MAIIKRPKTQAPISRLQREVAEGKYHTPLLYLLVQNLQKV